MFEVRNLTLMAYDAEEVGEGQLRFCETVVRSLVLHSTVPDGDDTVAPIPVQ